MLVREAMWKEITYDKYCGITRNMNKWEKVLCDRVSKEIKHEVRFKNIPKEAGILNSIKIIESNEENAKESDDFNYYEKTGYQDVFYGSQEAIKRFKEVMNDTHINIS